MDRDDTRNCDLVISDRTALDLENKVLDPGVSEESDAVDVAVEATNVLVPFVDALLPANCSRAGYSSDDHYPDHGSLSRTGDSSLHEEVLRWKNSSNEGEQVLPARGHTEEQTLEAGEFSGQAEEFPDQTGELLEDRASAAEKLPNALSNGAEEHKMDEEDDDEQGLPTRSRPACSRSSTFSERSVESCDSFVSAESRLEPFAEREELIKMFETFDENGDGKISCEELGNTMKKLGFEMSRSELESMVVAVDNDGDGFVDFDEFLALYSNIYYDDQHHRARDGDEQDLREAFSVFDKNKDGFITVVELQAVLNSLGLRDGGVKLADCRRMIKAVDADGDGQVNFDEFKRMMASNLLEK
ncbi:probable calcium-binding protein CML30 [Selaginella moellendorffii]|nr:probable calcium-binding protein CML30 [Selaginella moellendorffii]|eukprot:XP_002981131.2 probable calcium-binding protein CML30 [Selaginella moellendorffii]